MRYFSAFLGEIIKLFSLSNVQEIIFHHIESVYEKSSSLYDEN
jgi:hypothetical protein